MRKTIVTAAGPNMAPVLTTISLPFFELFARRHGYRMQVVYVTEDDADRWSATAKSVRWQKLRLIRSALEQSDVVVWFDADVLVCRTDTDIFDFTGATDYQGLVLHSVPSENRINPNTGVWVIKNTEKAFRFLDAAMEIGMPAGRWADQGAVMRALGWVLGDEHYDGARMPDTPNEFMDGTTWLPIGWNQPFLERYLGRPMEPNPFAIHFMGMSLLDRMKYMREVANHYASKGYEQKDVTTDESSRRLTLGFQVLKEVPGILRPLVDDIVACYRPHHSDLRSVFIIGSVAVGEWTEGVSDLDIVGVVDNTFTAEDEAPRRHELLELGKSWPQVLFINNSTLSLAALHTENPDAMAVGRARIIAVTGLFLWGEALDFQDYFPTVAAMGYGRATRAKILMGRYRSGIINEPFRSNPQLLARSCAKAAIRVLSGITILRDAIFYASSHQTAAMVTKYAPEAISLAYRALEIVDGAASEPNEAMGIAEQAVELFYSLYPEPS